MLSPQELYSLISQQKAVAGITFHGSFKDGFIAALDIVNAYVSVREAKDDKT